MKSCELNRCKRESGSNPEQPPLLYLMKRERENHWGVLYDAAGTLRRCVPLRRMPPAVFSKVLHDWARRVQPIYLLCGSSVVVLFLHEPTAVFSCTLINLLYSFLPCGKGILFWTEEVQYDYRRENCLGDGAID